MASYGLCLGKQATAVPSERVPDSLPALLEVQMDGCMVDEWMYDQWEDGRMDGQMDRQVD